MAKLIKNNRILLNNNDFPHEEASMKVLLAKERIFKLIQAWDEKQIESWSFPKLLPQFLNDSRTIEQAANLAVQQKQEEHADYEEMLQDREKFMQDTQTFLEKFNRYSFGVTPRVLSIDWEKISNIKYVFTKPEEIPELMCKLLEDVQNNHVELAVYINSPSWNRPTFFFDNDEEDSILYKEYLEKFSDAITTVLATEEPEYSPSMSDDESIFDEDVSIEDFKVYSNPVFDDEIDLHHFNAESDFVKSLSNRDTLIESSLKFDYLTEFSGALMPTSIVDKERIRREHEEYISLIEKLFAINSFPHPEEIDIFTGTDELLPLSIESDDYDSEEDIHFLEELIVYDSILFPKNESSDFDHQDDPSFPRPPPEPPNVEFDFKPNSREVISVVMNNIDELNEDECFNPGGEINVFANVEDDDYFPFIFVIRIFLPYLIYPKVSPLLLSAGSEDTLFNPGISV
uniref:Reverse transcriptase domain-containing protein n=1 Tax=Tanacetum cinerariifolium TaxID=118510 RepID=A0A6L2M3S3_TANCI|nr:hypothetical protein [Tanacetum cinerariifolium]